MRHSRTHLLRPTIWLPRADLDRLRAADAHEAGDTGGAPAPACNPPIAAYYSSETERDAPRRASVG